MLHKFYLSLCCLLVCCFSVFAQEGQDLNERIIDFHSDIDIDTGGLVKVTEHIKVYAAGEKIVHGLLRSIPLYRKDKLGTRKKTDFEILSVQKNGADEDYSARDEENQRNIYIGKADVTLTGGVYDYVITYQSRGHVGFFDGYDELYWNVTGNEWDFTIDKASATITVPPGGKVGNIACYTGVAGSTAKECNGQIGSGQSVSFSTSHSLAAGEGFTVAAAFTAGVIKRPGFYALLYQDYFNVIAGAGMILVFALLYYLLWHKYGRDPEPPVTVPSFHVPMNWSPALLRFFDRKGYDDNAAAVALINMGVKRAVKITSQQDYNTVYKFEKLSDEPTGLSAEEQVFFDKLFKGRKSIKTTESSAQIWTQGRDKLKGSIKSQLNIKDYYAKNTGTSVWTGIAMFAALVVYLLVTGEGMQLIMLFMLPFILLGVSFIVSGIKKLGKSVGGGMLLIVIGIIAGGMPGVVAIMLTGRVSPVNIIVMVIMIAMYIVFVKAIKCFTVEGTKIQTDIEGFKIYLSTAEENRLNLLNPPEHTPQVFEKFLPYAVALGVENAWGEKFSEVLDQMGYSPDWYDGDDDYRRFTSSVPRNFYSAVAVSPAPSSSDSSSGSSSGSSGSSSWSSGSSGSGSSGGGGGGGGGGGW